LPRTQAAKQLFQVEQLFFNAPGINTSIVRFGGLIGGARQPVKHLAGRTDLDGGNAPVNLIHKKDCIGIISSIIKQDAFGHIFNAVHPNHPKKKEYYTQKAKELDLIAPKFTKTEVAPPSKQVDSIHLEDIIGYRFKEML
jgi:nucleoside-diphosphate-sugar epimerase